MTTQEPYYRDGTVELYCGDAANVLETLPDGAVNCLVTSPPYWGLRDYGIVGQYGLEPSVEDYVTNLRRVFRQARRVLAATARRGSIWATPTADRGTTMSPRARPRPPHLICGAAESAVTARRRQPSDTRACSGCRGGSRTRSWRTAGSCGTRLCGTSRTGARRAPGIGSPAATRCCSSWSARAATGSTPTRSTRPQARPRLVIARTIHRPTSGKMRTWLPEGTGAPGAAVARPRIQEPIEPLVAGHGGIRATCGAFPPAGTPVSMRRSDRSRCRCGVSPLAANPGEWCVTRSAAPAPPASPLCPLAADTSGST
jgi:hypothetical protein